MSEQATEQAPAATAGLPLAPPDVTATRPATAARRAKRPADRKVIRYTLDLEAELHKGLRMLSFAEGVDTSKIMRSLVWLLISHTELPPGKTLAEIVLDEVFADENES